MGYGRGDLEYNVKQNNYKIFIIVHKGTKVKRLFGKYRKNQLDNYSFYKIKNIV